MKEALLGKVLAQLRYLSNYNHHLGTTIRTRDTRGNGSPSRFTPSTPYLWRCHLCPVFAPKVAFHPPPVAFRVLLSGSSWWDGGGLCPQPPPHSLGWACGPPWLGKPHNGEPRGCPASNRAAGALLVATVGWGWSPVLRKRERQSPQRKAEIILAFKQRAAVQAHNLFMLPGEETACLKKPFGFIKLQ